MASQCRYFGGCWHRSDFFDFLFGNVEPSSPGASGYIVNGTKRICGATGIGKRRVRRVITGNGQSDKSGGTPVVGSADRQAVVRSGCKKRRKRGCIGQGRSGFHGRRVER